jgi:hypothetical protein
MAQRLKAVISHDDVAGNQPRKETLTFIGSERVPAGVAYKKDVLKEFSQNHPRNFEKEDILCV